jgi:hypothetical protein
MALDRRERSGGVWRGCWRYASAGRLSTPGERPGAVLFNAARTSVVLTSVWSAAYRTLLGLQGTHGSGAPCSTNAVPGRWNRSIAWVVGIAWPSCPSDVHRLRTPARGSVCHHQLPVWSAAQRTLNCLNAWKRELWGVGSVATASSQGLHHRGSMTHQGQATVVCWWVVVENAGHREAGGGQSLEGGRVGSGMSARCFCATFAACPICCWALTG